MPDYWNSEPSKRPDVKMILEILQKPAFGLEEAQEKYKNLSVKEVLNAK